MRSTILPCNREYLSPWLPWIDSIIDASDTYAFLRAAENEAYEHTAFKAGVWYEGSLAGAIDLHGIDWANANGCIGYWLDKERTHRGIITSAARALIEYAFDALDLHRIEIRVATGNNASRRVPERLGFVHEGVLRRAQRIRGSFHDCALYALVRSD